MNLKNKSFSILSIFLICFLGILIYSNTFKVPFHFDDRRSILENYSIRNIKNIKCIFNFCPNRFITYFSFAINYHLHQFHVFGYHLFNLIIHLVTGIFVWWLVLLTFSTPVLARSECRRVKDEDRILSTKYYVPCTESRISPTAIALFCALLFIVHPIQTESVTYIVQRATSLATFFYIFSLCLYVKSRLSKFKISIINHQVLSTKYHVPCYYIGSLLTAVLGMFTKQIVITLPFMILLYEFFFLKDKTKKIDWKYITPFLLCSLIIPLTTIIMQKGNLSGLTKETETISRTHYLLTQFRVLITYIRLLFIPINQNVDYDYPIIKSLWNIPVLSSAIFLVFILFAGIFLFHRYRLISFSIFWFFLTISVESSIFPIRDVIFEHRLYLPSVGYSLFLATIFYYFFKKPKTGTTFLILITIVYSILTYKRNQIWKDEFTLWNDTVKKSSNKPRPYVNRGLAYLNIGNFEKAISDYKKALEIEPTHADAYWGLGNIYYLKGEYKKSISEYSTALKFKPDEPGIYYNRGLAYLKIGEIDKAISDWNSVLELNPFDIESYRNRAYAFFIKKDYKKALQDIKKIQRLGFSIAPEFFKNFR